LLKNHILFKWMSAPNLNPKRTDFQLRLARWIRQGFRRGFRLHHFVKF